MSAPTREDATLLVQIMQMMTTVDSDQEMDEIWADDFDPQTADPKSKGVRYACFQFETIGTFVKHDLLSRELVEDLIWIDGIWDRVGPAALKMRAKAGEPRLSEHFEALAKGSAPCGSRLAVRDPRSARRQVERERGSARR